MKYRTIVADPPWNQKGGPARGREGWLDSNGPSRDLPYPTMSVEEIAALPVRDLREEVGCHLYLWATNRYLRDAFDVALAWGFRPSTILVWAKAPMGGGLGGAFGISTEFIIFARAGRLGHTGRVTGTWFQWKRPYRSDGKPDHSAKPGAFYDVVESVSPGPYLELFARRQRLGWDTWGNEALEHVALDAPLVREGAGR